MAVRTPGTSLRHDGFTIFSPVAAISLPHRQVSTSQLRNAVFVFFRPTFYPITLFGRDTPILVHDNTIRIMSEDDVGSSDEERRMKAFQGIGTVNVDRWCSKVAIGAD